MKSWQRVLMYLIFGAICIMVGFVGATFSTSTKLTDDQINYFTEVAETTWYNGVQSLPTGNDVKVDLDINNKSITVSSVQPRSIQHVSVSFSGTTPSVQVIEDTGGFGLLFTVYTLIAVIVGFLILDVTDGVRKIAVFVTMMNCKKGMIKHT